MELTLIPSGAEVKERTEVHLYSVPVIGRNFHLLIDTAPYHRRHFSILISIHSFSQAAWQAVSHSFTLLSVLRQVDRTFQSEFSIESDLVLPFFNFQYPLVSLQSSSSCLRLLPPLTVTSNFPPTSPSITCFRRQFKCKM